MSYLNDFNSAIERKDWNGLWLLWEEYCAGDDIDGQELKSILEAIRRSDLADQFGRKIDSALPLWQQLEQGALADAVLRLIFDLETTESAELAQLAYNWLEERYGSQASFQQKARLVGLRGGKESFKGAIRNFELLNHLEKGSFVFHSGGWGTGEVRDVALVREQVVLEFDLVPGRKELSFENAFKHLIPLRSDHFLARRFGDPDQLELEARKDPVAIIKLMLKDLGPKSSLDIKEELCDLVIPAADWSRWWQSARNKLKRDPHVECPGDARSPFKLLDEAVAQEDVVLQTLQTKLDVAGTIQLVFGFIRDFGQIARSERFCQPITEKLESLLQSPELTESQCFQALSLLEDLGQDCSERQRTLILQAADVIELIQGIETQGHKKRALEIIAASSESWDEIFSKLLLLPQQVTMRDFLIEHLLKKGKHDKVRHCLDQLLMHPTESPDAMVWLFQKLLGKHPEGMPLADRDGRARAFESFLTLFVALEQEGTERDLMKKMHNLITANRFQVVRQLMEEATTEEVREILLLATKSPTLIESDSKILQSLAQVTHPSLRMHEEPESSAQDVIWTTAEGLQRQRQRLEHIATVETVENAKEIEAARALGDLRENSEFKFALERRNLLQQEIRSLSDQINKARILQKQDIPAEVVGIGSRVTLEAADGNRVVYSILGPWEADPELGIVSYQSKAAQQLIDKGLGDEIDMGGIRLRIVDLAPAL